MSALAPSLRRCLLALFIATDLRQPPNFGSEPATPRPCPIALRPVGAESGFDFRYEPGFRGDHHLPEIMGGGIALMDADGDGRIDLYMCNGVPIGGKTFGDDSPCRFYRNLGGWKFEDLTDRCGAPGPAFAMGTAVGDYDGDGRVDLFVT